MVPSRKSSSERLPPCEQYSSYPMSGTTESGSSPRSASSTNRARIRSGYSSQENPLQRRREMAPSRLTTYSFRSGPSQRGGLVPPCGVPKKCGPCGAAQTPLPTLFGKGPDYHSFPRVEVSTLEALEAASALTSLNFQ